MPALNASVILNALDREIWVVTASTGDRRGGCVATFVLGLSLVPEMPRVCLGLARHHHTWTLIESSNAFTLHLLGERNLDWVWRFGLASGHETDKFTGLTPVAAATGSPLMGEALAWMDCRVETRCDTGDRTVYVAEVVDASAPPVEPPLTVARMLRIAPPDRLRRLEELVRRDRALDATAITAWRRDRSDNDSGSRDSNPTDSRA